MYNVLGDDMERIKKNFGLGCMRFPQKGETVDLETTKKMIDTFLDAGFNYFDTARVYMNNQCETIMRECLTSRYPRDAYVLTDKLSAACFEKEADIRPLFEQQLKDSGVEYFDFYLMHAQTRDNLGKYKACRAYEQAAELRAEGKIRHLGISFHDNAAVLEEILTAYPQVEVVQLQLNYIDFDDPSIEGRKCLEICNRFNKPVIVMEPVKGGVLATLPDEAAALLDGNPAAYALRFAAGLPGVFMTLSGMGSVEMIAENTALFSHITPLTPQEEAAVLKVRDILNSTDTIPCTACRYCVDSCPQGIPIPELFSCKNKKILFNNWNADFYYRTHTAKGGKASTCIACGNCEECCPQHLPIRDLLKDVAKTFEETRKDH